MATTVQVTFDCSDPHGLARFWAAALHYEKEDHTELVEQLLATKALSADETVDVDGGPQFADVAACRDADGKGPRLLFQKVPERKATKTVYISTSTSVETITRPRSSDSNAWGREGSGSATTGGAPCWTMADTEGNEFCVD